jgi:hypothetical protein
MDRCDRSLGERFFWGGTKQMGGTNKKALVDDDHQSQSG